MNHAKYTRMCFLLKCSHCDKQSWLGCSSHLKMLFKEISFEQRCVCGMTPEQIETMKNNPLVYFPKKCMHFDEDDV